MGEKDRNGNGISVVSASKLEQQRERMHLREKVVGEREDTLREKEEEVNKQRDELEELQKILDVREAELKASATQSDGADESSQSDIERDADLDQRSPTSDESSSDAHDE